MTLDAARRRFGEILRGSCNLQSEVTFPVMHGGQYLVRIGGYNGATGGGSMTAAGGSTTAAGGS